MPPRRYQLRQNRSAAVSRGYRGEESSSYSARVNNDRGYCEPEPISLNLMISWSSSAPDDLKLVDMRDAGVHLPVTARDLAWLLSVLRRVNAETVRMRRHSANERVDTLAATWQRVREVERKARRLRAESAAERTRFSRQWRGLMQDRDA